MGYKGTLSYQRVQNDILSIKKENRRLVMALTYLTGSRIGEIVRHHLDKRHCPEDKMHNPPLKPTDITIGRDDNGRKMLVFKIQREKIIKKKNVGFRYVYINPERERAYCEFIWRKRNEAISENKRYMYSCETSTARRWFKQIFPDFQYGIHHLRHWRITHYLDGSVTGRKVPKDLVAKIVGHSNLLTTDTYDHVAVQNYATEL